MGWIVVTCLLGWVGDESDSTLRPFIEYRREMSAAMQREAGAADNASRAAAIVELTKLYEELKRDPRRESSPTLTEYKAELWSRLHQLRTELQRKFPDAAPSRPSPEPASAGPRLVGDAAARSASQSLATHIDLAGQTMGGPLALLGQARRPASSQGVHGARGGGAVIDFGPELVDLIQRTISPDHWDINGGPGSIVYYRAFHCLVVRASGDVHGAVGGLLGALK